MTEKIHKNREEFQHISEGGGFSGWSEYIPLRPLQKMIQSVNYVYIMTATWRLRKDINVVLVHKINWRNVWKCIIFSPLEFDIGRHFCAFGKNLKCAIFLISRYTEYEEELTVSGFDIRNVARIIVDFVDVKVVMILLVIGSVSFLWPLMHVCWLVGRSVDQVSDIY